MAISAVFLSSAVPVTSMKLSNFRNHGFQRGRSRLVEAMWFVVQAMLISSFLPGSAHRRFLLKLFGARIGRRVVIKPGVRIKFPWRLHVGDDVWIGEDVWIDNLAEVRIGSDVCISQGAYLCTGSHDWSSPYFRLITRPITVGSGAWLCARSSLGPGVSAGQGAVLTLGSAAHANLDPWSIYSGVPAKRIKSRTFAEFPAQDTLTANL